MTRPGRPRIWLPWTATSIRLRLLGGMLTVLVLGVVTSTVASYVLIQRFANQRSVEALQSEARQVHALLASGPQTADAQQLAVLLNSPMGAAALDKDGRVVGSTGSARPVAQEVVAFAMGGPADTVLRYDPAHRHGVAILLIRTATPGFVLTGLDRAPTVSVSALVLTIDVSVERETIRALVSRLAGIVAVALLLLAVLGAFVLEAGMSPLRRMAAAAAAIAAGSRSERLPTTGGRSEIDVLAAAVNQAFDAQDKAEAAARAFAADASHELRTPLSTISGWLDLHHQGGLAGADVERALERVDAEVGRMRLIVDELGLLARLDAGRPLDREPVDLAALAAGVVEDAQIIHPERAISLVGGSPVGGSPVGGSPVGVLGDAPRLRQVLWNLVGNAVQHTSPSTAVRVSVRAEGDDAVLTVQDDGPGIPKEHVGRVFERFWRAEGSRSRTYGGSGLGLAIVEAIVRAHDGTVRVDSVVGTGTTVTVRLPVGR